MVHRSEEWTGAWISQVTGPSFVNMPETNTPLDTPPPRLVGRDVAAFTAINPLGIQNWYFEAISPPAYALAYLRIGPTVTVGAARLATDLPARLWSDGNSTRWTTLPNFLAIAFALPFGPALPGRTDGHALRRRSSQHPVGYREARPSAAYFGFCAH